MNPVTRRDHGKHSMRRNLDQKGGKMMENSNVCFFKLTEDVAGALMRERSRVSG